LTERKLGEKKIILKTLQSEGGCKHMGSRNTVDYKAIGKRLSELRTEKNISQKELAERAGITSVYLSNMENGHSRASLATFLKVANALGGGVDVLLCDNLKESRQVFDEQLAALLEDCSSDEMKIITGTIKGLKEQIRALKSGE
jgi:transcriptional regulator with XRE-family HTH domain